MRVCRFYSEETRQELVEKFGSGNYPSISYAARCFGVPVGTLTNWLKVRGIRYARYNPPDSETEEKKQTVSEGKKALSFVEPEPDPSSFRNDRERAEYYMMRSYYLEELFRLCDLDEDSKKKALRQLEQRVRERLAKGDRSPY